MSKLQEDNSDIQNNSIETTKRSSECSNITEENKSISSDMHNLKIDKDNNSNTYNVSDSSNDTVNDNVDLSNSIENYKRELIINYITTIDTNIEGNIKSEDIIVEDSIIDNTQDNNIFYHNNKSENINIMDIDTKTENIINIKENNNIIKESNLDFNIEPKIKDYIENWIPEDNNESNNTNNLNISVNLNPELHDNNHDGKNDDGKNDDGKNDDGKNDDGKNDDSDVDSDDKYDIDNYDIDNYNREPMKENMKESIIENKKLELINANMFVENIGDYKHNVTFTSKDLNEIKSFANDNVGNVSSLASNSEFSYTQNFKHNKNINQSPETKKKNIRTIKNKKKQHDLDEVDYLYNKLQDLIRYVTISRDNYVLIIVKAIEIVENIKESKYINKKDIVTKAINRIIMIDLDLNDFNQRLFMSTIDNIIELIIICSKTKTYSNEKKTFDDKNQNIDDIVLASSGQIIHSLIDKLTTIVLKKQYTADKIFINICTITDILMILIDKYAYLTGIEKKMIVLQAINEFVRERLEYIIDLLPEKKQDIITAMDSVPLVIDILISVQKGKFKINKKQIMPHTKANLFCFMCCSSKNDILD
jgi:hypothetical protein